MTNITVGTKLPELKLPPISRFTLALFAGASGDHNPIHIDSDFAQKAGMPDVFAQGMLSMAYLGRLLTNWQPQSQLRKFSNKFSAMTQLKDVITCSGEVIELLTHNDEPCARVAIQACKQDGSKTLIGEAIVAL
ncbi:MaoC family dehydratase [Colwelliaceae bacterium BS250]